MFVLQIPVGAGLQGASWNLKWCRNRYNLIVGKFLHPDKRMLYKHPTLLPRAADFDRAIQEFNNSWQKLEPLLEQSEGVYVAPAAAQGDEARGASGTPLPGTARRRQRSQGASSSAREPCSPPPPPPMPKTPVEVFLSIDPTEGDELMPCVLSVTSQARQRPKAKARKYVELNERIRKDMALQPLHVCHRHGHPLLA